MSRLAAASLEDPVLSPVTRAPAPATEPSTVSTALVAALARLGVTQAYGVMGGAIAPFFHAVVHGPLTALHMRHETGAAFAAVEASLATGRPTLVFTTAGPGLANAWNGMLAARWEGAHVIFVSAATVASNRGRVATQETTAAALGDGAFQAGGALHLAATVEHPAQLAPLVAQLAIGLARPGGFVAHLSLPIDVQRLPCAVPAALGDGRGLATAIDPALVRDHAARFAAAPPVVWLGHGARHAAPAIRALVERLDARVMCSPRAKGVFPEDDPRYLGVTGVGGHAAVDEHLAAHPPRYTLVLGTRMGEATSFWRPELIPTEAFVHVDADPAAFGVAYPGATTEPVLAEVGAYVTALVDALGPAPTRPHAVTAPPPALAPRAGLVRPAFLMAALQRELVDADDAWLMAESGNAFCWATHHLRFRTPGRFRMSPGWGSMGHAACGVVGAALARGGLAVAVVGDGAMMMQNELHAAVQHGADALWIVLNDASYLMCAQGMRVMGWEPFACELPPVDFAALARAVGAAGERVTCEAEVGPALARARAARGPRVLDVAIDPRDVPPSGRRNQSLMQQGFTKDCR